MTRQLPLVVVLGATACGKSKLAIELARRFNGQIISADSMQVYHGLDIVTNKVTEDEQAQAKHHMISFLDPSQRYSVIDFREKSLSIIENLQSRNILPIVVGGTNYYIESLLWKSFILGGNKKQQDSRSSIESDTESNDSTLMDHEYEVIKSLPKENLHNEQDLFSVEEFFKKPIYNEAFRHVSSEKLWHILEQVDPSAAHLYHHRDKRKIIRCLQVIQEKNKNYTDLLIEANKRPDDESKKILGGPLRFNPTCVFWLNCDNQVLLDKILDERVDQMLNRGLLAELENFHEDHNKKRLVDGQSVDEEHYEKGIFQCIGFKEFHDYLMLEPQVKTTDEGNKLLKQSIEMMKISTRRYARYQIKWIKRRLLQSGTRDLPTIYKLDIPDHHDKELESKWIDQIRTPAFEIIDSVICDRPLGDDLSKFIEKPVEQSIVNNPGKFYCEPCERTFIGSLYIDAHLKSKTHQRRVDAFKRKQIREKGREQSFKIHES